MADLAAFMRSYYAAYNTADPEKLAPFYADDVVLTSSDGVIDGKAALLGVYASITAALTDQMTPIAIVADGETAAVEIVDVLTAKADLPDFLGMALSKGQELRLLLGGFYRIREGKIRTVTLYRR